MTLVRSLDPSDDRAMPAAPPICPATLLRPLVRALRRTVLALCCLVVLMLVAVAAPGHAPSRAFQRAVRVAPASATWDDVSPRRPGAPPGWTTPLREPASPGGAPTTAGRGFVLPVVPPARVVRTFDPPEQVWTSGHRGVDLAVSVGEPVRAAGAGTVTYSGVLAGRGVVTVAHSPTLRTTYEPVDRRRPRGSVVARGDPIGVLSGTAGHCAPHSCLHWGAISAGVYIDPMGLLGAQHPVLLPLGGG